MRAVFNAEAAVGTCLRVLTNQECSVTADILQETSHVLPALWCEFSLLFICVCTCMVLGNTVGWLSLQLSCPSCWCGSWIWKQEKEKCFRQALEKQVEFWCYLCCWLSCGSVTSVRKAITNMFLMEAAFLQHSQQQLNWRTQHGHWWYPLPETRPDSVWSKAPRGKWWRCQNLNKTVLLYRPASSSPQYLCCG